MSRKSYKLCIHFDVLLRNAAPVATVVFVVFHGQILILPPPSNSVTVGPFCLFKGTVSRE